VSDLVAIAAPFAAAFALCFLLLALLERRLPADFLVAGINQRSNHDHPVRQIGGLAAVPALLAVLTGAFAWTDAPIDAFAALAGCALMFVVGYLDDRHDLPVLPRFGAQFVAALLFVLALGDDVRILPAIVPLGLERAAAVVFLVWFTNLTNFMDGLDWMVVSGIGLPHALLALCGLAGIVEGDVALVCAAVAGALLGFAPANMHPARLFLGDSGSLAIGFLTGVTVLWLAARHGAAALLPFLYFLVDSSSVIVLRLLRGENVLKAHSFHAYQVARRSGETVPAIVTRVALLGILCVALFALHPGAEAGRFFLLAAGTAVVGFTTWRMRMRARRGTGIDKPGTARTG
jgi:UDP-N-acetylmuramyl pentapeptide phosphotransferase/UDP-N-acetylglucosamine-1-phosphate transferase